MIDADVIAREEAAPQALRDPALPARASARRPGIGRGIFRGRGILARLGGAVVVILGVVTVTFLLSRVFTADPTSLFVPDRKSVV